jgi:hypothetical protein
VSLHNSRVFAEWVKSTLVAGGIAAEIGIKPATVPAGAAWSVVYPIAGGVSDGTLESPSEDATPDIQVTSVARTAAHALEQVYDVRTLILAAIPATLSDGRRILFAEPTFADVSLIPDNDVQPPLYYCPDRFSMRTAS